MKRMSAALTLLLSLALCACNGGKVQSSIRNAENAANAAYGPVQKSKETTAAPQSLYSYDSLFPQHEPYGTGVGAMPGRVVWAHDPASVDWDGEGYWWELEHFDEEAVQRMVDGGIATLGGGDTTAEGWEALFRYHNQTRGKSAGYLAGEKLAIKANMNGSGAFADDTSGETQMSYINPILLRALLRSLVREAGVAPADITVYDVSRIFPDYMVTLCSTGELQGVRFSYRDLVGGNDSKADLAAPVVWSQEFSGDASYLPACVTEAEYLINLANLKGHSYGVTLCAKNHFGSLMNTSRSRPPEAAGIHRFVASPRMDSYTVLVDLMGSHQLGGKTMLYLLDGLICATSEGAFITGENSRWQQAPFNGHYASSVFLSQDPVAIDSVGVDFLMNEPTVTGRNGAVRDNPNVESYLHEAALVADAPSGTFYLNGNGQRVANLGVHEHWNNSVQKLYSRNLGRDEGIELVYLGG